MRSLLKTLPLWLVLWLTACGTVNTPAPAPSAPTPTPGKQTTPRNPRYEPGGQASRDPKLPPPNKQGGYYMDDGPADQIPPNLDQTPDAVPTDEPLHRFANRPYTVLGETWVPDTSGKSYVAEGRASWYGRKFHGQRTSSGEGYDMFAMTGAHRTLPIPSYARVTNLDNGKSVVVRINDRGPFHRERLIDLSYAAAYKLGYVSKGSTRVRVERVFPAPGAEQVAQLATGSDPGMTRAGPATESAAPAAVKVASVDPSPATATPAVATLPAPAAADAATPRFALQLGSFGQEGNAQVLRNRVAVSLASLGREVKVILVSGLHRVLVTGFDSEATARAAVPDIEKLTGIRPLFTRLASGL